MDTITVQKNGPVATIIFTSVVNTKGERGQIMWDLAGVLSQLREDNTIRVIVITGEDGEFMVPRRRAGDPAQAQAKIIADPARMWLTFNGIVRLHQLMAEMEKPIVARVNGDAVGLGSSLLFAADIIVAAEDAKVFDWHLGMGEIGQGGPSNGIVPGDGGTALVPLFMSPALAKEYLMLARPFEARELARMGVINHAVPEAELDSAVADIVERLLKRPAYALAWTKRIANRLIADQLNRSLDPGAAYEMVSLLQLPLDDWKTRTTLD